MSQQQLGRYRILEQVAAGTQGTVFRAYDAEVGHLVALKVLHPTVTGDASYLERFHREASLASSIDHPNVVQIFDVGEADGQHFIALEFLPENLARLIDSGGLPVERTAKLGVGIADGLGEVHALGIVHRDMKPQNVLITPDGTPKVTDFGIARTEDTSTMTATGALMGTPYYMSPEQARGDLADARSDVYAVGCILYQMLTGSVPFDAPTPLAVIRQQIEQEAKPVAGLRKDVPKALIEVVERAMLKDPSQRYANGSELAMALRQAIPGLRAEFGSTYRSNVGSIRPPVAVPDTLKVEQSGRMRRLATRAMTVAAIMVVGAVATLAAVIFFQNGGNEGPGGGEQAASSTHTPGPGATEVVNSDVSGGPESNPLNFEGVEALSTQEVSRLGAVATAIANGEPTPTLEPGPTVAVATPQPTEESTLPANTVPTPTVTPGSGFAVSPVATVAPTRTPTPTPTPTPVPVVAPQWVVQKKFTFDGLSAVTVGPDNETLIGGDQGFIYSSSDGGENWDSARTISGCTIYGLTIVSSDVAFAVEDCGFGLMKTSDGGQTWDTTGLELLNFHTLSTVQFLNEDVGWVAGSNGLLAKTRDGGETWDQIIVPTRSFLRDVSFASEEVGFVAGLNGILLTTADGGATWDRVRTPDTCEIKDINVRRPDVWVVGDCEQVMYSGDGGVTWEDRSAYGSGVDLDRVEFLNDQVAWVAGRVYDPERSFILQTTDGGESWDVVVETEPLERVDAMVLKITDEGPIGWAVGTGGLLIELFPPNTDVAEVSANTDKVLVPFTLDPREQLFDSLRWEALDEFTFDSLFAVTLAESGTVRVGGDAGAVYSSFDGGATFTVADVPSGCRIYAMEFPANELGFAIDDCGGIMRTTDGGESWEQMFNQPIPDSGLSDIFFLDGERGWAAGWNGDISYTNDGGETWDVREVPTNSGIEAVYFADENHGWVGGLNNGLLRTRDGGQSWEKARTDVSVCRVTAIDGRMPILWAIDECNQVFTSRDAGETWLRRELPHDVYPRAMAMWNDSTVWIAGEGGEQFTPVIIQTVNSGRSWETVFAYDEFTGAVKDIAVTETVDGPVGWAVGELGLVAKAELVPVQ